MFQEYFFRCKKTATSQKQGFTLIEVLIVITILAVLSTVLIQYTRSSESQLILFREQAKLVGVLSRTKGLSVATLNRPDVPCGYGIHFVADSGGAPLREYILFRDRATDCRVSDGRYQEGTLDEVIEKYSLDTKIKFDMPPITDILFIPPDPRVRFTPSTAGFEQMLVIETNDETANAVVRINKLGQISSQ